VPVARDNPLRTCSDRAFKNVVVVWIDAIAHPLAWFDRLGQ